MALIIGWRIVTAALTLVVASATLAGAQDRFITVASTTSTEQSGLFRHLLPAFEKATGIHVRVVAVGTGQALALARRGDADVVFVHDQAAEEQFIAEGFGVERHDVMYNDFVLVGPRSDPAGVGGPRDILGALSAIARARAPFVSRGDRSGTHAAEVRYWAEAGVDLARAKGSWYREIGSGMGPALNTAAGLSAYILADRGTWLTFKNRADLGVLVEGDRRLFNQYGIILVNPASHPHVKKDLGQTFIDWVLAPSGQETIASYTANGEPLFFPNARRPGS